MTLALRDGFDVETQGWATGKESLQWYPLHLGVLRVGQKGKWKTSRDSALGVSGLDLDKIDATEGVVLSFSVVEIFLSSGLRGWVTPER